MTKLRGHLLSNAEREAFLGWSLLVVAAVLLHDAYNRRGRDVPWWGRPFTFT